MTDSLKQKKNCQRTFKFRLNNESELQYRGRFTGKNPQQAAKKALTSILSEKNKKVGKFDFFIKETTRGSKKKEYAYTGKKSKRDKANKVYFPGQKEPVLYKYDTKVHTNKKLAKSLTDKLNVISDTE